jgi:hypothetical protein
MQFPHKCSRRKCRQRTVLARKITDYAYPPRCPGCKQHTLKFDNFTYQRRLNRKACYCDGMHHAHRPGSSVWCNQHPTGPTDEDAYDRYGR